MSCVRMGVQPPPPPQQQPQPQQAPTMTPEERLALFQQRLPQLISNSKPHIMMLTDFAVSAVADESADKGEER